MGDRFYEGYSSLGFLFFGYIAGSDVAALVFIILALTSKSKLKKMQVELEYLIKNCF